MMQALSTSGGLLGAVLVSIALVGCGDGDSLPEPAEQGLPVKTFSAPLPPEEAAAVVQDEGESSGAAADDTARAVEPVDVPRYTPEQMKSE